MNPKLIAGIIRVESASQKFPNGDDNAIGDRELKYPAYGPMQIRQPVCDDVNRVYATKRRAQDMLGDRPLSIDTFNKYTGIYATFQHLGHMPTEEDLARIWNGGPNGPFETSTLDYWAKVQKMMPL